MASLESLQTRALAAETKVGYIVDDKSLALKIVHVGSDTNPVVTVVSATGITLADDAATTGSLAFATYTTLGALVDKINSYSRWEARILDGLRATSTASSVLIPNSAVTAVDENGESVYKVFIDNSVNDSIFFRASMDRGVLKDDNARTKTELPLGGHRVKINGIRYRVNVSGATLNGVRIYEFDSKTLAETQVWGATSVDDTATTHDFTLNPITASEGNDLVVMFNDSAITDTLTNFVEVDYVRE